MKAVLCAVTLIFASCLYAQDKPAQTASAPGCGPAQEKFNVSATKNQPAPPQAEEGKALIYVIQDDNDFDSVPRPTSRIGVDGTWIGATRHNSYLRAALDPGEHHLCASWQNFVGFQAGIKIAALHFTAEPGKTYYFRVKDWFTTSHSRAADIDLTSLDSDEGQLLASKYEFSTSHPKK